MSNRTSERANEMKRSIIAAAIAASTLVVPATALAGGAYEQPGYAKASANTICADHGAFGYLGAQGERPNLGQGDTMGDDKLGASPLTGPVNGALCGNRS
jgi:hypothetical protein